MKTLLVFSIFLSACGGQINEGCLHTEPMRLSSLVGVFYRVTFHTDSSEQLYCGPFPIEFGGKAIDQFYNCENLLPIQNPQYLAGTSCVFEVSP